MTTSAVVRACEPMPESDAAIDQRFGNRLTEWLDDEHKESKVAARAIRCLPGSVSGTVGRDEQQQSETMQCGVRAPQHP